MDYLNCGVPYLDFHKTVNPLARILSVRLQAFRAGPSAIRSPPIPLRYFQADLSLVHIILTLGHAPSTAKTELSRAKERLSADKQMS